MTGREEGLETLSDRFAENSGGETVSKQSQNVIVAEPSRFPNNSTLLCTRARRLYFLAACGLALFWCLMTIRYFQGYILETPYGRTWGVADDIYISADFARTFAEGEGLRWYPGAPKVEGFSNPLWVLVIAALHLVPGFQEDALGLWVLAVNLCIITALAFVFVRGLSRFHVLDESAKTRFYYAIALGAGGLSICFFSGIGTEFALIALLSLGALVEAARKLQPRTWLVGLLIALAFLTRMDALLPCSAALLLYMLRVRKSRSIAILVLIIVFAIVLLLVFRKSYFNEWLPNTYFLKSTGWTLRRRLFEGLLINLFTIALTLVLACPFFSFAIPRSRGVRLVALSGLFAHALTLMYTTRNGGDSFFLVGGFDRFTSVGSVLFMFALAILVLRTDSKGIYLHLFGVGALCVMLAPLLTDLTRPGFSIDEFFNPFRSPYPRDTITERFIKVGKVVKRVTRQRARVAVCGAGAVVYFSHRGGVDVLGKVDPYVARLDVPAAYPEERRCIRLFPGAGHNKEDVPNLFRMRKPDLSTVLPPTAQAEKWVRFKKKGIVLFARKSSPRVRWKRIRKTFPVY